MTLLGGSECTVEFLTEDIKKENQKEKEGWKEIQSKWFDFEDKK